MLRDDTPQRDYSLREVFNAVRWLARAGAPWRLLSHDFPPWYTVYQQAPRWLAAGVFEAMVADWRAGLRWLAGREEEPAALVLDSRTRPSRRESGPRAGDAGATKRRGSQVHRAVDPLGDLLTLHVTAANEQDRAHVERVAADVQELTGQKIEVAFVAAGYTVADAAQAAATHGSRWEVIKLPEAKRGFVLLPRRWVVERSFGWLARFRRLARDYERLPETLIGLHYVAFAMLMLTRVLLGAV